MGKLERNAIERKGWVKLYRKLLDSRFFGDSYVVHLIDYLLLKANYEDKKIIFNGQPLELKRGQSIFGLNAANRDTGISIKRIRRRMGILESEGFLKRENSFSRDKLGAKFGQKRAWKYTIVTICNYDIYQGSEDDDGQGKGQDQGKDRATHKEYKEIKNNSLSPQKQSDPRVREFLNYWQETFLNETGHPYVVSFGKEGRLIKQLLQVHNLETLQDIIRDFFQDEQAKRRGFTIGIFFQEINRLLSLKAMNPLEQVKRELQAI
jgi:hypothetical protein